MSSFDTWYCTALAWSCLRSSRGPVECPLLYTRVSCADYDLETPLYTFFIQSREADEVGFYVPEPNLVASWPIGLLSAIFLLLSALDHIFVTLPGVNSIYNKDLCYNRNKFRWMEYAFSAGLMRAQIAALSGWVDVHLLFAIFCLTATTMLFGWLMETVNGDRVETFDANHLGQISPAKEPISLQRKAVDWTPFLMGGIPHLMAWSIVACGFFQAVKNGDPPGFVWAIIFILFTLDGCFAIVQLLQFSRVKGFRGFAHAEIAYIILSLTSKQLLAWIEFGGAQSLSE